MTRLFFLVALMLGTEVLAETINVRALALRAGELPEVYLKVGEGYEELHFSAVQPSSTLRALSTDSLSLYKLEQDADGNEEYVIVDKLKVPASAKGVLLLGWKSEGDVRYLAIEDDFSAARFDDWLLINTSKKSVAFMVEKKGTPVTLKAGSTVTYRLNNVKEGKGASIMAQAMFDGEVKLFFSTYWALSPGKRSVVIFLDDGRKIRVKRISDKLVVEE